MREIIIESPTYGTHTVLVDDEDYEFVSQYTWSIRKGRKTLYAISHTYKVRDGKSTHMHKLVMNCPDDYEVDHKDHNGLNNQKCNLRLATPSQNRHNMTASETGSSKYKGVSWNPRYNMWHAQINCSESPTRFLGLFVEEVDAARQYDYFALKYYGEFAHLNFPEYNYSSYVPPSISDFKSKLALSKYRGVTKDRDGRWMGQVMINKGKKKIHLGCFPAEVDAARAFDKYVIENNLNRKLNFPEEYNGTQES